MTDKREWHEWLRVLHEYVEDRWFLPAKNETWESGGEKWNIGAWVYRQRTKHAAGDLPAGHARLLELVPDWDWKGVRDARWRARLEELRGFVAAKGVPTRSAVTDGPGPRTLGRWVAEQRGLRRKGALSAERARALESIPGWEWLPSQPKITAPP